MKKPAGLLICLAALAAAGCSKQLAERIKSEMAEAVRARAENAAADSAAFTEPSVEDAAEKLGADARYTNSWLGFSFTVPKGWWMYRLNEANFALDPSLTERPDLLDISYGEDAGMPYSYIALASFANLRYSQSDSHLGFDISAETLDGVDTLEGYMEYLETYMLAPDENDYRLLESGEAEINGLRYETRAFEVIRDKDNYIYATYTRPVGDNWYLTIKANYWPRNRNAETFIAESLSKAMR